MNHSTTPTDFAARPSKGLALGLSLAVVALAFAGYGWTGSPQQLLTRSAPAAHTDDANALLDRATALAIDNQHVLAGEPTRLIERALQIEPDNLRALALSGAAAFARQDYDAAVRRWERLAQLAPPDSDFAGALRGRLELARRLAADVAAER